MLIIVTFFIILSIIFRLCDCNKITQKTYIISTLVTFVLCAICFITGVCYYANCSPYVKTDTKTVTLCKINDYYLTPTQDGYEWYEDAQDKKDNPNIASYIPHTTEHGADIKIKNTNETPYCEIVTKRTTGPKWLDIVLRPFTISFTKIDYTFYLPEN